jgi:hypothetical protein
MTRLCDTCCSLGHFRLITFIAIHTSFVYNRSERFSLHHGRGSVGLDRSVLLPSSRSREGSDVPKAMSRSRHAPRYLTIEQAIEGLLAGKKPPPPPPQNQPQHIALDAGLDDNSNRTEPSDQRREEGRKRQRQSEAEAVARAYPSGAGEMRKDDCDSESRARNYSEAIEDIEEEEEDCRIRFANVVAVVTDVSEAQPTRASSKSAQAVASSRRRSDGASSQLHVWIQDESLQTADDPSRHRAAVTYWVSASAKKEQQQQQQQQLPQMLRAGDVVALHGLVLRKSCLREVLQDHRRRHWLGDVERSTDSDMVPPYEFAHDANATVFHDNPLLDKVRLLARADPVTQHVHWYNTDENSSHAMTTTTAGPDSTLTRRVSQLIQWYLSKSCTPGSPLWRTLADADEHSRHCRQRSVADLQATLGVCGHVVAQITAIQEHSCASDAVARRKESFTSTHSNRKRRSTAPRSHEADSEVAFVLLKDSTSSAPIPLVLLGRNNVRTFRDQLEGLLSTGGSDPGTRRWVRWTRVKSVRMREALAGTSFSSGDIDDTAVALIPTEATTVSLIPQEEASDFSNSGSCLHSQHESAASLETSQPTQLGSADATHRRMAASAAVTVEAPIASIRIVAEATSKARAGSPSPPTTIVLNAANVQDNAARVLALLRQPIQGRAACADESSDKKAGRVDDVAVFITLDWSDAAALGSLPIDLHNRSHLTASQHVVHSLFWGGTKWESVVSGRLDDICCRMVAGMLQEYVRFHWILERQDTSYRIVDVSLRQL